ncbi:MAG: hypothetical protein ACK5JF_10980, partial [Oscillospiraceae bacterium]
MWQNADTNMQHRLKLYIATRLFPMYLPVIFGALVVGSFSALFLWVAFITSKDTSIGIRIFIVLFLLALGSLLMYGVIEMLKTEKKMSGLQLKHLFTKNIQIATGKCIASYIKEINYTGIKETTKLSDFQVGTYKVTRSFANEVPLGAEYIFIKPINTAAEIVF